MAKNAAALVIATALILIGASDAFNITTILKGFPSLSKFNDYLSKTHIASEINNRQTITVLALDNAAMDSLLAKGLSLYTMRNVLAFHVLVDYYGASKLHSLVHGSTLAATIFQSTGDASGTSGYVNITDLGKGKVGFSPEDNNGQFNSFFVKSVKEMPFDISVVEISQELISPDAEAPVAPPSFNLTDILKTQGCSSFSELLVSSGAEKSFDDALDAGLTVLCPSDGAISSFEPSYKNLTAKDKTSLMLYHGLPVYNSMQTLKMTKPGRLKSTLASSGGSYQLQFHAKGTVVTVKTPINSATIGATIENEYPLVVYKIDKVLMPKELFKSDLADAPAPGPSGIAAAPEPSAESPVGSADEETPDNPKKKKKSAASRGLVSMFSVFVAICLAFML